ncbi:MAG: ABC transporter substrate-binding protein [Candidatus Peregrinibacteria bacterium]
MPSPTPVFTSVSRWERILILVCITAFCVSFALLLRRFYVDSTVLEPATGGTYIEGSVGELSPLIPWFTVTNDVSRDIVSLVFSGLLKYNPETKRIEDDLATMQVGSDRRVYTLKLKNDLFWHDHTPDAPHPVTADDVVFTFKSIQDPEFPNAMLRQNFLGVTITKIDDRTVRFHLEEPYSFFPSNLTLGLLPKRSFEGIPPSKFDQVIDFGTHPIGAGPYAWKSLMETELSTEVTLQRFDRTLPPPYQLNRVIFRIFPDYQNLLSDIRNLDGVRLVPRNERNDPLVPRNFRATTYTLPQYVALFFNLDRPKLQEKNLRLGLQLGTDKEALVKAIGESVIVDTPFLELTLRDWRYQYTPEAAQGALFSSNWNLPEKVRLQRLLEMREANNVGVLHIDPVILLDTGAILTVTGSLTDAGTGATLADRPLQHSASSTGTWIVALTTQRGTGSLSLGQNLVKLVGKKGEIIDSCYVWRTTDPREYRRAVEEQRLLELFVRSRREQSDLPADQHISVQNLSTERGMLRQRLSTDPYDIRINDSGERLSLTLLTSNAPPQYAKLAALLKEQWAALGVHVVVEVAPTRAAFEERVLQRDYDVLLFGQSLLDNLDCYPYWHSAGIQKLTGKKSDLRIDAYNLSQYSSLKADTLLEFIRQSASEEDRQESLQELREIFTSDVPAIFLYSPLYTFALSKDVHGVEPGSLSLHSDRFLTLHSWFTKQDRTFAPGKGWLSFFPWLLTFTGLSS